MQLPDCWRTKMDPGELELAPLNLTPTPETRERHPCLPAPVAVVVALHLTLRVLLAMARPGRGMALRI